MPDKMPQLTERARHVLDFAQEAANQSGDPAIGIQHLVLGLTHEGIEDAARLDSMESDVEAFVVTLAHELKPPLAAIKVAAQLLPEITELDERAQAIEIIDSAANKMLEMYDGMIISWRAASVTTESLRRQPCDLKDLIDKATSEQKDWVSRRSIDIHFEFPAASRRVTGDEDLLLYVVENLVGRAVFSSSDNQELTVSLNRDSMGLWFRVRDQGPHIPENKMPLVFNKHHMHDTGRVLMTGFAGIKTVIEAHGGTIEAHNLPSGGVEFAVLFPAAIVLPPEA